VAKNLRLKRNQLNLVLGLAHPNMLHQFAANNVLKKEKMAQHLIANNAIKNFMRQLTEKKLQSFVLVVALR